MSSPNQQEVSMFTSRVIGADIAVKDGDHGFAAIDIYGDIYYVPESISGQLLDSLSEILAHGYEAGYETGYERGHADGFDEANEEMADLEERAYDDGYEAGLRDGAYE